MFFIKQVVEKICILFVILLIYGCSGRQNIQRVWINKADTIYGFFTVQKPASDNVKGVLVLLDGFGGNAEYFLNETQIDEMAFKSGWLLVNIPTGNRLYADSSMMSFLNIALKQTLNKYHLSNKKVAIGGLSAGGVIALRYAELCYEKPENYPVLPAAVFSVDAPVDLERLYHSAKEDLSRNPNGAWGEERKVIISMLEKDLGKPDVNKLEWMSVNPFSVKDSAEGNEKFLYRIPYRTYHDVDINWGLKNRQRSIYGTNMPDASELIRRLNLNGNDQAEFIQSTIKGVRSNGQRHPHSWNIVDAPELMRWLNLVTQ